MSRFVRVAGTAVLSASLLSCLAGCGKTGQASGNPAAAPRAAKQAPGVSDVLAAGMAEADKKAAGADKTDGAENVVPQETEKKPERAGEETLTQKADSGGGEKPKESAPAAKPVSSDGIDVDLPALSATMVYSEVFNMMVSPENYIGKTIKMAGQFYSSYDEIRDRRYYACLIMDATACCAQGMEFVLDGNYSYPEDYPAEGGAVCVTGVFDSYEEDGCAYATLRNARMSM